MGKSLAIVRHTVCYTLEADGCQQRVVECDTLYTPAAWINRWLLLPSCRGLLAAPYVRNKNCILTSILLFSLLLTTIADYNQQSFDLLFLVPAAVITLLYNQFANYKLIDWISFGCITFVLSWNIFKQKMGSGDLLIYLIIASYFSVTAASLALLVASFLAITVFIIEQNNKKQSFPFLPYIFIGLIFTQFLI